MDQAFLREVQKRGWVIVAATTDACEGRCPIVGCGIRAVLRSGKSIPERTMPDLRGGLALEHGAHAIEVLQGRRKELRLTVEEVEDAAGVEPSHLAKIEHGTKMPNIDTFIWLAQSLGYDLVLREGALPAATLRTLADTRPREASRGERFAKPKRVLKKQSALLPSD